ncbi:MAG: HAMP domain-containing histidine kinase [Devosiaceae bacterium]|nr:HAMP domain-containing histidine kinase [Devosiaceae bacterium MH13]
MSSAKPLRLFRTTAFKLAAGYLVVFGLFAAGLVGYLVFETSSVLVRDADRRLTLEARRLGQHYQRGGINGLYAAMEDSAVRAGNRLYALSTPGGDVLVSNIGRLPEGVWSEPGLARFGYDQIGPGGSLRESRAIVRVFELPEGFRVIIGLDIGQADTIRGAVRRAAMVSLVTLIALGLLGWLYVNRRVLRRLDGISATTGRIIDGRLSERIAIMGTGDEFDRLGEQLNVMLDRLERSMDRLKEVSDNIAHDLRTPLTRMRNTMEDALRQPPNNDVDRQALEKSLEEADRLMATFQALLTIARVEAGGRRHTLEATELGSVITDVMELYEPVAEDAGVALTADLPKEPVRAIVNRELVGLALANLIDNALKYGASEGSEIKLALSSSRHAAMLSVSDHGPGIPLADRERVRDRFVRLDKSRTAEGSGLGLALVDAVAAFHDGTLELADAEPGLMVRISLPLGHDKAGATQERGDD